MLLGIGCSHTRVAQGDRHEPIISVSEKSRMFYILAKNSGEVIVPGVDIFSDGRCIVRNFDGEVIEKKLSASKVRDLMDFFSREGLFDISTASIDRAIDRELQPIVTELPGGGSMTSSRGRVLVVDGSVTCLAVRTLAKQVEISRHALSCELKEYQTVVELRAVDRCIKRVYQVAGNIL